MKITRKQSKTLKNAIHDWQASGLISNEIAQKLVSSYQIAGFDWRLLARYSFWISVTCIAIAVSAIVADRLLDGILIAVFGTLYRGYCALFALLAAALFAAGLHRKKHWPGKIFSNESIFLLGVLAVAASLGFIGADLRQEHYTLLLLAAAVIYALLGLWFPSRLVWVFALLSLGSWLGAETGYLSGWGAYYLGMNYPLRFAVFGTVLTAASFLFTTGQWRSGFYAPTRVTGLLYLFIALWLLSIFGNYGDIMDWYQVKQWELLHWSLVFGAIALLVLYLGIRFDDRIARGFGLTFLFINLYTRFFEYFWDHLHKAVFFILLGLSFWYLGTYAERIRTQGASGKVKRKPEP